MKIKKYDHEAKALEMTVGLNPDAMIKAGLVLLIGGLLLAAAAKA